MGSVTSCSRSMSSAVSRRPGTYVINPTGKHTATVIFFHGLGDNGHGWSLAMQEIREPHIKYICPTATSIPVTLNYGMSMPSWFDLYSLQIGGREDADGIRKVTKEFVTELIAEEEAAGISSEKIVLGGFSQGGALALYSALTYPKRLAGVVALSTWLPLAAEFPNIHSPTNKDLPILLCHGDADPLVSPQVGGLTKEKLCQFIPSITAKVYRGLGHSSSDEELQDVKEFINKCLSR